MDPYPVAGPTSEPLLSDGPFPPPSRHKRRRSAIHGRPKAVLMKWWKPLTAISAPIFLLYLYSLIHPHIPGLPALPKIKIDTGDESRLAWNTEGDKGDAYGGRGCVCGQTKEGKRLCDVYGEAGLTRSRLVEGSGARMRRILAKARAGNVLKVGVLGGSGESVNIPIWIIAEKVSLVSACHGLHPTSDYPQGDPAGPGCYPTLVRGWFAETFPSVSRRQR